MHHQSIMQLCQARQHTRLSCGVKEVSKLLAYGSTQCDEFDQSSADTAAGSLTQPQPGLTEEPQPDACGRRAERPARTAPHLVAAAPQGASGALAREGRRHEAGSRRAPPAAAAAAHLGQRQQRAACTRRPASRSSEGTFRILVCPGGSALSGISPQRDRPRAQDSLPWAGHPLERHAGPGAICAGAVRHGCCRPRAMRGCAIHLVSAAAAAASSLSNRGPAIAAGAPAAMAPLPSGTASPALRAAPSLRPSASCCSGTSRSLVIAGCAAHMGAPQQGCLLLPGARWSTALSESRMTGALKPGDSDDLWSIRSFEERADRCAAGSRPGTPRSTTNKKSVSEPKGTTSLQTHAQALFSRA